MREGYVWAAVAAVCVLGAASVAPAAPSYSVGVSGSVAAYTAYDPNNGQISDSSQITGPNIFRFFNSGTVQQAGVSLGDSGVSELTRDETITSPIGDGTSIPVQWRAHADSSANATAELGTLHASATAAQFLRDLSDSYVQTNADGNTFSSTVINPLISVGHGSVSAASSETFTLASPTLALGTPVQLRLRLAVDCGLVAAGANSTSKVLAQAYCTLTHGFASSITDTDNFNSDFDGQSATKDLVFSVPMGWTVTLNESLDADAIVQSFQPNTSMSLKVGESNAAADAGNTAHFYMDVVDGSDASLVSASGVSYAAPVPEPTSALAAAGFAAVAIDRRRRR